MASLQALLGEPTTTHDGSGGCRARELEIASGEGGGGASDLSSSSGGVSSEVVNLMGSCSVGGAADGGPHPLEESSLALKLLVSQNVAGGSIILCLFF